MKVGTDAMLLGAFTDPGNAEFILDIGTGSGVLALMMAQKSAALIDGIDIEPGACRQANENVKASQWAQRIEIINATLEDYAMQASKLYDLIICNPPYYAERNYNKGQNFQIPLHERSLARSIGSLSPLGLIKYSKALLSSDGKLWLIFPFEQIKMIEALALERGLYIQQIINIRNDKDRQFIRSIIEFGRHPGIYSEIEFTIYASNGIYTDEYINLTSEFHAKNLQV
jgi:tRNA1Val (adenine37-N6)-methyltransferase